MLKLSSIYPLTDFVRNAKIHAARIKETKTPEVLTINGRPELVVQDAASYESMVSELEKAQFLNSILEGERDVAEGRVQDASEAFKDIKGELGL